ncbi:MAG: hypothetical protein OHK0024_05710 [Thalassobaculales bacterium]
MDDLTTRAIASMRAGDAAGGLALFRAAAEAAPQDPAHWHNLALALEGLERWEEAVAARLSQVAAGDGAEAACQGLLAALARAPALRWTAHRRIRAMIRPGCSGSLLDCHARIARSLGQPPDLLAVLEALSADGWAQSLADGTPRDPAGAPLPLYTAPAIAHLAGIDWSGAEVFEFGAGWSTLWWAARCRQVVAVESDPAWVERLRPLLPANAELRLAGGGAYPAALDRPYDMVVVDGAGWRHDGAARAAALARPGDAVLLDNAEWHPQSARLLREAGLIGIDFTGLRPGEAFRSVTSLFLGRGFSRPPLAERHPPVPPGGRDLISAWDRPGA